MTKYKICKFLNGNSEEWYQILEKGWFFWHYITGYSDFPREFKTIDQVNECINRRIIKKVECVDYGL